MLSKIRRSYENADEAALVPVVTRGVFLAGLILTIAGCSAIQPLVGISLDGEETYAGELGFGSGPNDRTIALTTNKGRGCSGPWESNGKGSFSGKLTCANGETGTYSFVDSLSENNRPYGSGTGEINNRAFTFTFR